MSFEIENDFEFYCFLKARLPKQYQVIAEPSTSYYSEWMYNYQIFLDGKLIDEIKGNFKEVKPGELVSKANEILNRLTKV